MFSIQNIPDFRVSFHTWVFRINSKRYLSDKNLGAIIIFLLQAMQNFEIFPKLNFRSKTKIIYLMIHLISSRLYREKI